VFANSKLLPLIILVMALVLSALAGIRPAAAPRPSNYSRQFLYPPEIIPYDNDTPSISVSMPSNYTSETHSFSVNITVTKPSSWNNSSLTYGNFTEYYGIIDVVEFSLDGQWEELNMSTPDTWMSTTPLIFSISLPSLADGLHYICINASGWCLFAPTLYGTMFANYVAGTSGMIDFTINAPPNISVLSPEDQIYNVTTSAPLIFTTDEPVTWMAASLDGQSNITIAGNTTLTDLTEGSHMLQVYAQVPTGSIGASEIVTFTVDFPPNITLLEPIDMPYNTTDIPVEFNVSKSVSWIGYSLDDQDNVSISGNMTLFDLPYGEHILTIYAADVYGNVGQSQTVTFARYPLMAFAPPPYPMYLTLEDHLTLFTGAALAVAVLTALVLLLRRKRRREAMYKVLPAINPAS